MTKIICVVYMYIATTRKQGEIMAVVHKLCGGTGAVQRQPTPNTQGMIVNLAGLWDDCEPCGATGLVESNKKDQPQTGK